MSPERRGLIPQSFLAILFGLMLACALPADLRAMGMGWGDPGDGGETPPPKACTPDAAPVLTPGPLGSPVRIATLDADSYLVADYSKRKIYRVAQAGPPTPFIEPQGKPLSIAVRTPPDEMLQEHSASSRGATRGPARRGPARRVDRNTYYFIGNDDARTLDVYVEAKGGLDLRYQLFRSGAGVQALDLAYAESFNELLIVDGLSRTIQAIDLQFLHVPPRVFGQGFLNDPKGVTFDAETGEIYVTDYGDPRTGIDAAVKVFDRTGILLQTITGAFSRPQGIAVSGSRIFVTDALRAQVLEFDRATGTAKAAHGCMGSSPEHLMLPMDVTLDQAGENFYIADNRNMRVTVVPLTDGP